MGFLFDSLRHLLASEPEAKREAMARLVGRALGIAAERLDPPEAQVWHLPKVLGRPFAVSLTLGGTDRQCVALTLADRPRGIGGLLAAVADTPVGATVALPPQCLGRSSHTWALVTHPAWPLPDVAEHERILGTPLHLIVPITDREARWIEDHGSEAFVAAMQAQSVDPYADRPPGQTALT